MRHRICAHRSATGSCCRAAPLRDGQFCLMHAPDHADAVQEARRLGGQRRKREATVAGAYDFQGLDRVATIRRLVEIAVLDALSMENSIPRARVLLQAAQVAQKLLETGELEERIEALEAFIKRQDRQEE